MKVISYNIVYLDMFENRCYYYMFSKGVLLSIVGLYSRSNCEADEMISCGCQINTKLCQKKF